MNSWPSDRPGTYDPDLNWDEENQEWNSDFIINPGNYKQHLVAIGEDGDIYFGEI